MIDPVALDALRREIEKRMSMYDPAKLRPDEMSAGQLLVAYRSAIEAYLEAAKPAAGWMPIETAPKIAGKEILGVRYADSICVKEPFISFWSPTLNKFYCNPSHFMPLPAAPEPTP